MKLNGLINKDFVARIYQQDRELMMKYPSTGLQKIFERANRKASIDKAVRIAFIDKAVRIVLAKEFAMNMAKSINLIPQPYAQLDANPVATTSALCAAVRREYNLLRQSSAQATK